MAVANSLRYTAPPEPCVITSLMFTVDVTVRLEDDPEW